MSLLDGDISRESKSEVDENVEDSDAAEIGNAQPTAVESVDDEWLDYAN